MSRRRQLLLLFLFFSLAGWGMPADGWELAYDKDGTRVYTQLIADSPYKQVKVTTTIRAPLDKVVDILMAFTEYKTWMYQVQESYLINRAEGSHFVFIREDAAWPIQDRYQVARVEVERSFRRAQVEFHVVPNYIEKRTDAIQIRQCDGYWSLEARGAEECALEFVLVENPGGHVPAWLSNLQVADKPFQTVSALKQLAERQVIRP